MRILLWSVFAIQRLGLPKNLIVVKILPIVSFACFWLSLFLSLKQLGGTLQLGLLPFGIFLKFVVRAREYLDKIIHGKIFFS